MPQPEKFLKWLLFCFESDGHRSTIMLSAHLLECFASGEVSSQEFPLGESDTKQEREREIHLNNQDGNKKYEATKESLVESV